MPPESVTISRQRAHQIHKRGVRQGIEQHHVGKAGQHPVRRAEHVGVTVDRVDELYVGARGQQRQRSQDAIEARPEILAAVAGDQHQPLVGIQPGPNGCAQGAPVQRIANMQHGIDAGIPRDEDSLAGNTLAEERRLGPGRGGKVPRRDS